MEAMAHAESDQNDIALIGTGEGLLLFSILFRGLWFFIIVRLKCV